MNVVNRGSLMADAGTVDRFDGIYRTHYRSILAYFRRRVESLEDAQDLADEVFVVAWRRFEKVPQGKEARLWLYGVARNVLANHRRSRWSARRLMARVAFEPIHPSAGPAEAMLAAETDHELMRAVAALRRRDREVLRLAYWDELSRPEIAELLHTSRSNVNVRIHRAVRRLEKSLTGSAHVPVEGPLSPSRETIE
jgi:RNA polymerase sigma-70 factor (ECF subfamily)